MTPKQKANELVDKFKDCVGLDIDTDMGWKLQSKNDNAKQCALICVDEIINAIDNLQYNRKTDFWENVKQEINNL